MTGGLWHEWDQLPDLAGIGYPIAEVAGDGSSVITKPEGTGGLVSVGTVTEQLLYEIDDPARYRTPDVDVDFTTLRLAGQGPDRVAVRGATGRPPSDRLKLAIVYRDGWTASGMLAVVGRDAEKKARAAGALVLDRVRRAGFTVADSLVECFGAGDVVPGVGRPREAPWEVIVRVTVRDPRRPAVERFCRELAPLVTAGPPGIAGYAAGRPSPRPAFGYWPALVPRSLISPLVEVNSASAWSAARHRTPIRHLLPRGEPLTMGKEEPTIRLGDLAHARSGDKGNTANIGVVARDDASFAWLRSHLTEASGRGPPAGAGDRRGPAVRAARAPRVQLRHREGPGRRGEPVAPAGHARQGSGHGASGTAAARSGSSHVRKPRGEPAMSEPLILRSDDGPVAVLTLNRPDKRNALSRALMRELEHHLDRVGHDSRVRTVVLTGAGTVFCSGMDLKEAAAERDELRGGTACRGDVAGVCRPDPEAPYSAQADDRGRQRRRPGRRRRSDGGVRLCRRLLDGTHRLSRGPPRPGSRGRHVRPDPADRRSPGQTASADRRTDSLPAWPAPGGW